MFGLSTTTTFFPAFLNSWVVCGPKPGRPRPRRSPKPNNAPRLLNTAPGFLSNRGCLWAIAFPSDSFSGTLCNPNAKLLLAHTQFRPVSGWKRATCGCISVPRAADANPTCACIDRPCHRLPAIIDAFAGAALRPALVMRYARIGCIFMFDPSPSTHPRP